MNDDAVYIGKLYTKEQLIELYCELKRKYDSFREMLYKSLETKFDGEGIESYYNQLKGNIEKIIKEIGKN